MSEMKPTGTGFFPNLLSISVFGFIMIGMFFGFTRVYPGLIQQYILNHPVITDDDTSAEERLAPFVRGVLSGVKTAQLSSIRETGPLDISAISGYKYGVQTALLASKNWYNLDRQLFRVRGLELGFITALEISRPIQERASLSYQVKLIQRIQVALSTNLEELLTENSESRRLVLENYIKGLKDLSEEASIEIQNMERTLSEAQAIYDQGIQTSEQYSSAFVSETTEFVTDNIDANLDQDLEARKQVEEAQVRIRASGELFKRLQPLSVRLTQVSAAIEANFDALAAGVKITATPGVDLPLVENN